MGLAIPTALVSAGASGSGGNLTTGNTFNCSAGDRITVEGTAGSSNTTVMTAVNDSGGNTYVKVGTTILNGGGPVESQLFECANAANAVVNGNVTLVYGANVGARSVRVTRWTGSTSAAFLSQGRATGTSTSANSGAVSPANYTQPNGVIGIGFTGSSGLSVAADTGAGFADGGAFTTADAAITTFSRVEYKDTTALNGATATFTLGASDIWISHCMVVDEASGGSVTMLRNSSLNGLSASGPFFGDPLASFMAAA